MQTVKPNKTSVFMKPVEVSNTRPSGIIVPTAEKFEPKQGTVINIGGSVTEYKANDTVFYKEYATTTITLNDDEYLLIDERDILGKIVEVE